MFINKVVYFYIIGSLFIVERLVFCRVLIINGLITQAMRTWLLLKGEDSVAR